MCVGCRYPMGDSMSAWCTVLCYFLSFFGVLVQVLVQRLRCVKHKAWALLATWSVYVLQAVPVYLCTYVGLSTLSLTSLLASNDGEKELTRVIARACVCV